MNNTKINKQKGGFTGKVTYSEIPSAGKVLSVLVEGHSHYPVCCVERLLYPVTMVNVNVYVQHSLVVLEQFQDTQHNVVDIAKT